MFWGDMEVGWLSKFSSPPAFAQDDGTGGGGIKMKDQYFGIGLLVEFPSSVLTSGISKSRVNTEGQCFGETWR